MKRLLKVMIMLTAMIVAVLAGSTYAQADVSNTPIHWGFKKGQDEKQADAGKKLNNLLEQYDAVYKGDPTKKNIYLTFDNGYENGYTEKILDVLVKEKVPATFFVTGHYLESAEDIVYRMSQEGHTIGNHSWHHPDMTKISDDRIKQELEKVRAATEEITGKKQAGYLRPPRGIFSERTMEVAKDAGYTHIFWSLAFVDWNTDQQKGWKYSYDKIMNQIHPGAILLLHTVSKDNADALEKVIKDLKKQGYQFKTLDDLMWSRRIKEPMLY
ncbi:delta-lactam-biosynthetic de-N-acetylase [Mesobacillus harenae]|uniref:delta-lactam-biosynthetic de-N-acetylase n=1 Tax=Mesobacillus harenae TaxID=2213203 RepID=UPI0015803081|nr:delta-lactam-biosynthetic de-N-acetylase [Mesobacillus harenae]